MAIKNAGRVDVPPGTAGFQPANGGWAGSAARDGAPGKTAREAAVLLAAYLYGSLPVVYLLGAQRDIDLRRRGSGNVGGSNLWAAAGAARGLAGWVGDASKGLVPVLVARRLGCREVVAQLAGVCGVAGQCWPLFLRFNGGRGISAFVGAAYALDRTAWVAALLPMIGGGLWRVAGLASRQRDLGAQIKATRSKAVPLGCFLGVVGFPAAYAARAGAGPAPTLLSALLLLRRLTAPLPDDAVEGPSIRPQALLYRLLYDRNTSQ